MPLAPIIVSPDRWTRGSPDASATRPTAVRPGAAHRGAVLAVKLFVAAVVVIVVVGVAAGLAIVLSLH